MGATTRFEGCITHGPWGGSQGEKWMYMPEGLIKKISVAHGKVIDSIKFESSENQTSFFGGKGGNQTDTISIDYPNEYLMSISGTIGRHQEYYVVKSICFVTNVKRYGPYGTYSGHDFSNRGLDFSYDGKGGVIVGFHGFVDKFLVAIGIYVMPKTLALGGSSTCESKVMHELSSTSSMSTTTMPREAGPWGGSGGRPWDDGVFSTVKQVRVHIGRVLNVISSIQFEYVKRDATSVLSQIHGGTDGDKLELVNLDGTNEYLTGISGFYGPVEGYNGLEAIRSISFHTNKTIHGPYGEENSAGYVSFASPASLGKVVGFHGRNTTGFLIAIGVHMEYF